MTSFSYKTSGVCSREITFDIENNTVSNIRFIMGCNGNTQGVSALCEGMQIDEIIKRLEGINCNGRGTSCPDQLAKALIKAKENL
ncbi:MAG: TIGR03905 family TSCPD domain-containing protein [Ruminococcaceae bacterium]|nr:TIGR03905 family TSCPD domain-containing protein [Oscillospiraceae bacterium]